jgi:hypothetical protein
MGQLNSKDPGEDFLRQCIWAEEDRHLFTSSRWAGGYRWFRSPNVVCLEQYRRRRVPRLSRRGVIENPRSACALPPAHLMRTIRARAETMLGTLCDYVAIGI